MIKFVALLSGMVLLASCAETPVYEEVFAFDDHQWQVNEKPKFTVSIADDSKSYDFVLTVRTSTDYPYSNLWIFMKSETPDGITAREPFEIKITDEMGRWIGNKTGSIVETALYFKSRKLPVKGKYTFTIEQAITASVVDEVLDIGFRVEETKNP